MAAKPEADGDGAKAPAKSKKLLIIIVAAVVVVALGVGVTWFVISRNNAAAAAAAAEDGDDAPKAKAADHSKAKTPPAYLPLDNMVVNLADPGGERVAQVGITLEVTDAHAVDSVKAFLPTIRSGILMLISQRTAEELLSKDGKEKLAKDILVETSLPFGGSAESHDEEKPAPKKKKEKAASEHGDFPVLGVKFSSFLVQ